MSTEKEEVKLSLLYESMIFYPAYLKEYKKTKSLKEMSRSQDVRLIYAIQMSFLWLCRQGLFMHSRMALNLESCCLSSSVLGLQVCATTWPSIVFLYAS
jgi:hypothetical protein